MNLLIAPNSMKGSLDAVAFAAALEAGFRSASPVFNIRKVPVADGGDFTGPVLWEALGAGIYRQTVTDPLGRRVEASYGIAGRTAVIEMASASGMRLLAPDERNPLEATSRGTGELMAAALERGCTTLLLGAGGSATIDGGIGMLEALGFVFYDRSNNRLQGRCSSLPQVSRVVPPEGMAAGTEVLILADVPNPLLGEEGAVTVFGPQKGATPASAAFLEAGLANWITVLETAASASLREMPGMGAAGGIASGLVAFMGGRIVPGAAHVFNILRMEEHIRWADWVFTGEGTADTRGTPGKAPGMLASLAARLGKPVTLFTGSYDPAASASFDGIFPIGNGPQSLAEQMASAAPNSSQAARQLGRFLLRANPEAATAHELLTGAETFLREDNPREARNLLDRVNGTHLSGYWYLCGLTEQKHQHWAGAINCFQKCTQLDPGHTKAAAALDMTREILAFRHTDLLNP